VGEGSLKTPGTPIVTGIKQEDHGEFHHGLLLTFYGLLFPQNLDIGSPRVTLFITTLCFGNLHKIYPDILQK